MRIISIAPSRLGLLGGSTDMPSYSDKYGGFCVNFAISLKSYVTLNNSSSIEDNIYPPLCDPALFDFILKKEKVKKEVSIQSRFDGIIGSGLGSSASSSVALLGAIYQYSGKKIIKSKIAEKAWKMESIGMGWQTGRQDQNASALGGGNAWTFEPGGFGALPAAWPQTIPQINCENLYDYMLLVYTGGNRQSRLIQKSFSEMTLEKKEILDDIKSIAKEGYKAILDNNIKKIAELMRISWALKKKASQVTNEKIDFLYKTAKNNGALSGKLCGAGGSGYMLFLTEDKKRLSESLDTLGCETVPFTIDYQGLQVSTLWIT